MFKRGRWALINPWDPDLFGGGIEIEKETRREQADSWVDHGGGRFVFMVQVSRQPGYPERRVGRQTDGALVGTRARDTTKTHPSTFSASDGQVKRSEVCPEGQGARVYG